MVTRPMKTCTLDGCQSKHRSKGLCNKHYRALLRHGTPTPYVPSREERFWSKVDKTDTCWLWTAGKSPAGYGRFSTAAMVCGPAHRYAYEICVGPIPEGLVLDHLCRVRHCVNPDHLEPVTNRENVMRGAHPKVVTSVLQVCQRGHDMRGDGAYIHPRWGRACRECRRLNKRKSYLKTRAQRGVAA